MATKVEMDDPALRNSEERFRLVVESVPNAIVMIGPTGLIGMVNAQTERVFGYSRDQLLGQPVEMLVPERYRRNHPGLRTSFFAGIESRPMGAGRDLYGLRKDGSELPLEIGLNPIETNEGTMVLATVVDISDRKQKEQRIHAAISTLAHMNRAATAGELSASIAHEVSQPLAAVVANANAALRWLANESPDLDEARAALKAVVSAGHRAGEVIGSVRAMFKKNSGERSPVDLNGVIRDVLRLVSGELEAQGIIVKTGLTKPLPLVLGNHGQLQQVILNLIRNAADSMESVSGRPRVLAVNSAVERPDGILVTVEDSGKGIDPKDIDRIFDSFFTTKSHGMGMGLSICRSIIEDHRGRLWVSPAVDHGSIFKVKFPALPPDALASSPKTP